MGNPDTTIDWISQDFFPEVVNRHGLPSQVCFGNFQAPWRTQTHVQKRAIKRAYKRALTSGFTWYREQLLTPKDFELHFPSLAATSLPRPLRPVPRAHHDWTRRRRRKDRWHILTWNPGGISSARFRDVLLWLSANPPDLVIIPETRWRFTGTWQQNGWFCIHSAGDSSDPASGIMVLIHSKACASERIRWQELHPGRLLHVKLSGTTRSTDVLACYQFSANSTDARQQQREAWWTDFARALEHIPVRNQLITAGDFNCSLPTLNGLVGADRFSTPTGTQTGHSHADRRHFIDLVTRFELCALNGWDPKASPSFQRPQHHNRIDFIFARLSQCDTVGRSHHTLHDAPFLSPAHAGHWPILCALPKRWYPGAPTQAPAVILTQRKSCFQAWMHDTDTWATFGHQLTFRASEFLEEHGCSDVAALRHCHTTHPSAFLTRTAHTIIGS